MEGIKKKKIKLSSFQIVILGFLGVILLGALLLMMPFSSREGVFTPFNETLFTATSAVCVTGLVVHDTATYWSTFGHILIIILIQIGGLGVVSVAVSFALMSGRKISLFQRGMLQDALAASSVGGIVKLTGFLVKMTLLIEFIGALLMMPVFISDFGLKGIGIAMFHSISAFCNAGFDLMGTPDAQFSSLVSYRRNISVNIVLMLLIVIGGIGFRTWNDIRTYGIKFKRYSMQSKVILTTTLFLIFVPALLFFINDYSRLDLQERILASLFQSVTSRTAGFNTEDLNDLSEVSRAVFIVLMLIGGAPGSTAGGLKVTTFTVLLANSLAVFNQKADTEFFGRRINHDTIHHASTILVMYITLFFMSGLAISLIEGLPLYQCFFETASAVGTVGVTLGITPGLGVASQLILVVMMFLGRVGGLTVIYATFNHKAPMVSKMPEESITVG